MPKISAGLLMYRRSQSGLQVMLVHPGGPFFRNKDEGAWTIPKGELASGEEPLATACREFEEETSMRPMGPFLSLTAVKQKGGKIVHAWAFECDCDPAGFSSDTFTMEWPPRSGRQAEFPEVDRAEYFDLVTAKQKINPAQVALLDELEQLIGAN